MTDNLTPLAALRAELSRRGLTGFIVPRADEHQGEYVPPQAKRLCYLTGFSGSAGMAMVLPHAAAVFSDGRYTVQMRQQVDTSLFALRHITDEPPTDWIAQEVKAGDKIGFDPWLHTPNGIKPLREAVEKAGASMVACGDNPLDAVWLDQSEPPASPVFVHPVAYSGRVSLDKRRAIAAQLERDGQDAAVLTLPESIAWLLNVRAKDVPCTPLPLSFAIIHKDATVDWFIDPARIDAEVHEHLGGGVSVRPRLDFIAALAKLGAEHAVVRVDATSIPLAVTHLLKAYEAVVRFGDDPCLVPKACKNSTELDGMRKAHRRDGAAMAGFLRWFAEHGAGCRETDIARKLKTFRAAQDLYVYDSFPAIVSTGPNAAINHYNAKDDTCRTLQDGEMFLLDSGGQYLDGTTDVTRTFPVGDAALIGDEQRRRYTRVLQGMIDLSLTVFPAGTTGSQIDCIARRPLWTDGVDFDHGTGHGVGSFLGVHEGPQRISKVPNAFALKPGMILSNEPGYYKPDAYGIRIENLVAVCEIEGGERPMLGFETLTLVPINTDLIEMELMTAEQIDWLNAYHARVFELVSPLLNDEGKAWLASATAALQLP